MDIDGFYDRGIDFFKRKEYFKAIKCFNKVLELEPNHFLALYNTGGAFYYLAEYEKSLKFFEDVLKIDDRNSDAWYFKGCTLLEMGKFKDAIKDFDKALNINPKDFEALNDKGVALLRLGETEESLKYFDKSLDVNPDYYLATFNKGCFYTEMDNLERALSCFRKTIKLNQDYADAWFEIGSVLKGLGKKDESNTAYEKFVETVRKNKFTDLYSKARRVSEYLNWVKKAGKNITFNPEKKPQYWIWVTRPEHFLEDDGTEREILEPGSFDDPGSWWTCHRDTNAGDLALIYRAGIENGVVYRDIKYLIMARSDAYPLNSIETAGNKNWNYGCDYIPLYKFDNPLRIKEIRDDSHLDEWNALRAEFRRQSFKTEESVWKHLNNKLSEKNPEYIKFLKNFDREEIMANILEEEEVENELIANFHIMEDFGHKLEFASHQEVCTGDGGKMDILSKNKETDEYVVIELKVVRANRCTFGQISSYMGWVKKNKAKGDTVKGIVVSRGYDNNFHSAMETNPDIDHIELKEVLPKLGMKLK